VLGSLIAEIEAEESDTVLISAEHFSSRFGDRETRQLASDFADYDCRIAVVLRDHCSRIFSAYSQTALSGRNITLDEFCHEIFQPHSRYVLYAETIQLWERAFGRNNTSLFCYSPGENIVQVLCGSLLSSAMPLPSMESYWDNRSLGPGPTERLRRAE